MAPPSTPATKGLTITNPLVLYRALLATQRISPDESQHRLAIHLQKLYHRLKDYTPTLDYAHRLEQISTTLSRPSPSSTTNNAPSPSSSFPSSPSLLASLRARKSTADTLALTRTLTSSEAAMNMTSPRGLLLHGEVGTGKSMLVDMLADSLPTRAKRRWHFSAFMLETFARLEQLRRERGRAAALAGGGAGGGVEGGAGEQAASVVLLARDLVAESPIVFLDEFQLPDRASAKILSGLFTAFFQLGGVLVATSNRMPEELAKAAGVEFAPPPRRGLGLGLGRLRGLIGGRAEDERDGRNMFSGNSDFVRFLDVLKARCEVWEMSGGRDWRRMEAETARGGRRGSGEKTNASATEEGDHVLLQQQSEESTDYLPPKYHIHDATASSSEDTWIQDILTTTAEHQSLESIPWVPHTLNVYSRSLILPRTHNGIIYSDFSSLCASNLGPADYISLASTFHTLILTDVPILTLLQKNEARRFITLLDALYEARCRLLIRASAGPDDIFFPEINQPSTSSSSNQQTTTGPIPSHPSHPSAPSPSEDPTYAESFSDMYQDLTSPFRPNISSYDPPASAPSYRASPLPSTPSSTQSSSPQSPSPQSPSPHVSARSILADEDADFGPVYGAGRSHGASTGRMSGEQHGREVNEAVPSRTQRDGEKGLDFQNTAQFTGADERFAFARARSRLWEMCGERWWGAREGDSAEWWRPVRREGRAWEGRMGVGSGMSSTGESGTAEEVRVGVVGDLKESAREGGDSGGKGKGEYPHGATSPFRTSTEPPPKIGWQHAWGMVQWGKRAGNWGKGADGLGRRIERKSGKEPAEKNERDGSPR